MLGRAAASHPPRRVSRETLADVSNASRYLLMNLESLAWDPALCANFRIPMKMLPAIRSVHVCQHMARRSRVCACGSFRGLIFDSERRVRAGAHVH